MYSLSVLKTDRVHFWYAISNDGRNGKTLTGDVIVDGKIDTPA